MPGKLRWVPSIVITALLVTAAFADTWHGISAEAQRSVGFLPQGSTPRLSSLLVSVPSSVGGSPDLMDKTVVSQVGGVIFVETAKPSSDLSGDCPNLSYEASKPHGQRLVAKFTSGLGSIELADWEIVPLFDYVESGREAIASLMTRIQADGFSGQKVAIHPAVQDTLAGLLLLLSDVVGSGGSPTGLAEAITAEIPGFNLELDGTALSYDPYEAANLSTALGDVFYDSRVQQIMFTDWHQSFVFSLEGNRLSISGLPYYLPLDVGNDGRGIPIWELAIQDESTLRSFGDISPMIYRSVQRVSKASAFLRFMKSSCPSEWESFDTSLPRATIDTIRIKTPDGVR